MLALLVAADTGWYNAGVAREGTSAPYGCLTKDRMYFGLRASGYRLRSARARSPPGIVKGKLHGLPAREYSLFVADRLVNVFGRRTQ